MNRKVSPNLLRVIVALIVIILIFALLLKRNPSFLSSFIKSRPAPIPTTNTIYSPSIPDTPSDELVNKAKADLSQKVKVDPAQIKLVSAEKKSWPDSSLGCPKPGRFYSQIVTQGFLLVLEAKGTAYKYHTSLEQVISCS